MLNLWLPDVHIESQKWTLNITVFLCCGNFLDKWKVTYLIKKTLNFHFVEPINWLGLYLSYNWIMQLLKIVPAIFFYQQIIPLKKLRKTRFYLFYLKAVFFPFSRYSISIFLSSLLFLQPLLEKMIEINS